MTPQEQFAKEMTEALGAKTFPADQIPMDFGQWLSQSLQVESMRTLGCDWASFEALHTKQPAELTLQEMGIALNSIESRTPAELRTCVRYLEVQKAVAKMAATWNAIVSPIKEGIQRKIETQMRISKGVPQGKQIIGQA